MPLSKEGLKKNATPKDIFQFRDGDNVVRILPPTSRYFTDDIDFIAVKFLCHYNIGPEGSPPIICPRTRDTKEKKHRCPICDAARRLRRNPATKELAGDLSARTRYIMNIVDMEHTDRGVQVAEVGPSVYDKIFEVAIDREYGDVLDLKVGRNFKITLTPANRSKTGYNSYSVLAGANPSSIKEVLPKGWKDKIDELEGRVNAPPSEEELLRLTAEATGTSVDEIRGSATPPRNARTSRASSGKSAASEEFVDPSEGKDSVVKEGSDGSPSDDVGKAETAQEAAGEDSFVDASDGGSPADGAPDGAEPCWGSDFQPSAEKCKACAHNESCMERYIEG